MQDASFYATRHDIDAVSVNAVSAPPTGIQADDEEGVAIEGPDEFDATANQLALYEAVEAYKRKLERLERCNKTTNLLQKARAGIEASTPDGVLSKFLDVARLPSRKRTMNVQPTALSRRKGEYRGGKRLRGGKAPHCLGKNIANNQPHAKKH